MFSSELSVRMRTNLLLVTASLMVLSVDTFTPAMCPDSWIQSLEGCFRFQYTGDTPPLRPSMNHWLQRVSPGEKVRHSVRV